MARKNKTSILIRAFSRVLRYKYRIAAIILYAALSVAAQLAAPVLAGRAIDSMIVGQAGVPRSVITVLLLYAGAAVVSAAAGWAVQAISVDICARAARDLRDEAAAKLRTLPLSYLDTHPAGDILSRITNDVETFSDGLLLTFTQLFSGVLTIFGTLGFMLVTGPAVGLTVAIVTPLSLFSASFIARKCYKHFRAQSEARGSLSACASEYIEGADVVDIFAYENNACEKFNAADALYSAASLKATFFGSLTNPTTRFINSVIYAGVILASALTPGISVGTVSCFLSYTNQYTKPFNEISGVIAELQNAAACAARVFAILDTPDEVPDNINAATLVPDGSAAFENVSFSYNPNVKLIKNLSLAVTPGMRVAIVGPTGCGKTTLINLLMRFYDVDSGAVKLAGRDIREVTRASLRRGFGMVLQDTWLTPGTVRENIAYGDPDATDEEIRAAAVTARAESFIRRLPNGFDTVLGEDGGGLSQGQKQLLCIARVMLRLPPMLILDEATSSIDTRTEHKIQSALAKLMEGRTGFIVAHRLSTIRDADIILVMRDGDIVEQGRHDELLKRGGFYAKLFNSQFEGL
mgnify:CR=1 FL=1